MADPAPAPAPTWSGHPSQWTNAAAWAIALVVAAAVAWGFVERDAVVGALAKAHVPRPGRVALWIALGALGLAVLNALVRGLLVRSLTYRVEDGALRVESGWLSRRTETLELYRVRDIVEERPFLMRLIGLGNVTLLSNDASTPSLTIGAVHGSPRLASLLRDEINRARGRVRVLETEADPSR